MIALYSEKEGQELLEFARKFIEASFKGVRISVPDKLHFRQARGVYVFIKENGKIRGSFGFQKAGYALGDAIARAIYNAAFQSVRAPLTEDNLKDIKIEIHVLNDQVKVADIMKDLDFGNDGLVCRFMTYNSFLLPNVIQEKGLSKIQFIEEACSSAGLPKDYWQNGRVEFHKFRVQSFRE